MKVPVLMMKHVLSRKRYTTISIIIATLVLGAVAAVVLTFAMRNSGTDGGNTPVSTSFQEASEEQNINQGQVASESPSPTPTTLPTTVSSGVYSASYLQWSGDIPQIPDVSSWSWKANGMTYDADAISNRIWVGKEFNRIDSDIGVTVSEKESPDESVKYQVYIQYSNNGNILYYEPYMINEATLNMNKDYNIPYEQASADAATVIEKLLGSSEYAAHPSNGYTYQNDNAAGMYWWQYQEGLAVYDTGIWVDYTNSGIEKLKCRWLYLSPVTAVAPESPMQFNDALGIFNHVWTKQAFIDNQNISPATEDEKNFNFSGFIGSNSPKQTHSIKSVDIVLTDLFDKENRVYSPAWRIGVSEIYEAEVSDYYYVDMATGDVTDAVQYWLNPDNSLGHTPSAMAYQQKQSKLIQGMKTLFPLIFADTEHYVYFIRPSDQNQPMPYRNCAEIWRLDKTTLQEVLLDDRAAISLTDDPDTTRNTMFAALIGDRIVFKGYETELDMKSNGHLISIDLDGGDRRGLEYKYNHFSYLCADKDRIYYAGWPGNERDAWPLNYVDATLSKNVNIITSDKMPFAVKDGIAYALNSPPYDTSSGQGMGNMIYRLEKGQWVEHLALPFSVDMVIYQLEYGTWLLKNASGQEMFFSPGNM